MTMRTYTYFICPSGHKGHELLSENDQPYSKMWERTTHEGVSPVTATVGSTRYRCTVCGEFMLHDQSRR